MKFKMANFVSDGETAASRLYDPPGYRNDSTIPRGHQARLRSLKGLVAYESPTYPGNILDADFVWFLNA
jgi:hypothetical protein